MGFSQISMGFSHVSVGSFLWVSALFFKGFSHSSLGFSLIAKGILILSMHKFPFPRLVIPIGEDNVATGASSDFEKATSIASQIVKSWGMSSAAGTRTYGEVSWLRT